MRIVAVVIVYEAVFLYMPAFTQLPIPADAPDAMAVRPRDTLWQFAAFVVPCAALLLTIGLLHHRGFWSLIGPRANAIRDLKRVAIATGIVLLIQEPFILAAEWENIGRVRPLDQWLMILPFAAVAILVQVSTEELYFRGYLQQQLSVISDSHLVWILAPSIWFGIAHVGHGFTFLDGLTWMIWATTLGLACADLTARTGNLGAAIGLHLSNNAFAVLVIAVEDWPDSGLALILVPYIDPYADMQIGTGEVMLGLLVAVASVGVMWLAARVAVRR